MNKKSFTLLELIIVIIIAGILTSLALPRYFRLVEVARATEAITHLKIIRQNMESCYASTQSYMSCNWRDGIDDPNTMPNRHFQYSVPIAAQSLLRIEATRSTYELSVDDSANCTATCLGSFSTSPRSRIVLCVEQASGKIAMAGCGIYANIH